MNRIEIHKGICDKSHITYKTKNADYGDSYAKLRRKYPNSILIRLNDKLNRLEVLMNGGKQQVSDESIDDTLLDLATYAIMELTEREFERRRDQINKIAAKFADNAQRATETYKNFATNSISEIDRNCTNCRYEDVKGFRCADCMQVYLASGNYRPNWEAKKE